MPLWLAITIAVFCGLSVLAQIHMWRVYSGKVDSPTTGFSKGGEPSGPLASTAIRSAISFAVYGILVLVVRWPQLLTYLAAFWVIRSVADLVICALGRGMYSVDMRILNEKGQKAYVINQFYWVLFRVALFGACIYFFGF